MDAEGGWFDESMKAGSHLDFIALHHYSPDGDVAAFREYVEAVYAKYKLPIWVTEWAYIDYSKSLG